jgi:hypothetical protein
LVEQGLHLCMHRPHKNFIMHFLFFFQKQKFVWSW